MHDHPKDEIQKLENEIYGLTQKLEMLRRESTPVAVKNYTFKNLDGFSALGDSATPIGRRNFRTGNVPKKWKTAVKTCSSLGNSLESFRRIGHNLGKRERHAQGIL